MKINCFVGALCLPAALAGWLSSAEASGLADHAVANGDALEGYDANDHRVWRYHSIGPLQVAKLRDGSFEVNGQERVGKDGRLLTRLSAKALPGSRLETPFSFDAFASEAWTPATNVLSTGLFFASPVFDSSGNLIDAVYDENTGGYTAVMKSNGVTGSWSEVAAYNSLFWEGSMTADSLGNITMVNEVADTSSGSEVFKIEAARYQPSTGWSALQTIYSTPNPDEIQLASNVYVTYDSQGDAIVVADLIQYGAAYWVYSANAHSWGGLKAMPTPITPTPLPLSVQNSYATVYSSNLTSSPSGKFVEYTYAAAKAEPNPSQGFYTNAFDIVSGTFGSPILVPNTAGAPYDVNVGDRVPAFVDDTGAVSVIWINEKHKHRPQTFGSRYSNGAWTSKSVFNGGDSYYSVFTDQAMDSKGDFVYSFQGSKAAGSQNITVIKYIVGKGWSNGIAVTWSSDLGTRERTAWLGTSGDLVEVFMMEPDLSGSYSALSSTVFNGSSWSTYTFVPPNNVVSFLQEMASDSEGNVGLLYNPADETSGASVTTLYSTFITP